MTKESLEEREGNTNCLQGMECPNCGALGDFVIEHASITATITVCDDGVLEEDFKQTEWEKENDCTCCECGHSATVRDFTLPEFREDN